MQRFSWQTRTICATGANVECQSNKLPVGGGGGVGHGPLANLLDSLKCNFLHSLDQHWLTRMVF